MAEAVLFNVAKSLLDQLSSPLKDEFILLWTSKRELEKLHNTIATIKGVLLDAERKQPTSEAVRGWLARLQEEMYKADDLFDSISTRALQKEAMSGNKIAKEVRLFFSKSKNLALLVSTAHKVKELKRSLDEIAMEIRNFGFITIETEAPRVRIRREEYSYVKADDIIGRENDKEKIVELLMDDADDVVSVSIITIIGIGGLGKTALAQLVYNEKQVQEHFELCLWACVNDFKDLNVTLEKIIAVGTKDKCRGLELEQLQYMLREKISRKKYLLVLDDVWDEDVEDWLRLKALLDVGNIRSKILVTTRSEVVAKNLSTVKPYYYLGGLSDTDAWTLFQKFAIGPKQSGKTGKMEKIGRDLVKKCANLPLAIRTLGSFLCNKDEKKWLNVLNSELYQGHNKVMDVLKISYNDLPSSLKHCFAYCSLFPKDYEFRKDELIRLWMALGFLESSDRQKSLEDVGEEYFYSLLQRCFFQDVQDFDGDIRSCKMHDLLHDLAAEVAGRDCKMVNNFRDGFTGTHYHVSYNCEANLSEEIPLSLRQTEGLRTLLFHDVRVVKGAFLDQQVLRLASLRVLDLSHLHIKELPMSIGKLFHLRYLDLSMNVALVKLPTSLCKLQNLLTLKLSGCLHLKELPGDLKLLRLRHLDIDGCNALTCMPSGLKQMTSLVTLDMLVVNKRSGGLRYLRNLNNLKGELKILLRGGGGKNSLVDAEESMLRCKTELSTLAIEWSDLEDSENEILTKLSKLLALEWGYLEDLLKEIFTSDRVLDYLEPSCNLQCLTVTGFPGSRISNWVSSLENLTFLSIVKSDGCRQLPPFRQLYVLKRLYLESLPLVEYMENDICYDVTSFFPSLETLYISRMPKLKGWWSQTTSAVEINPLSSTAEAITVEQSQPYTSVPWFPRLSYLYIMKCPNVTDFPLFPSAKQVLLDKVNEKLLNQSAFKLPDSFHLTSSTVPSSSVPSSTCAHQAWCELEELSIVGIEDLVSLPYEWIEHLSALHTLRIRSCPKLKSLPHQLLRRLKSLKNFSTLDIQEMDLFNDDIDDEQEKADGMPWIVLKRLRRLHFSVSESKLLKGLHHLTALKELVISVPSSSTDSMAMPRTAPPNLEELTIYGANKTSHFNELFHQLRKLDVLIFFACDDPDFGGIPWEELEALRRLTFFCNRTLKAIPERCQYLPTLQELEVGHCLVLESLPDWVARLQVLKIIECPRLRGKYTRLSGPCWPQIRNIPHVVFSE